MPAGPKMDHLRPKRAAPGGTGPSRTVGAAYTGATCFRQCRGLLQAPFFETSQLGRIYLFSRCFSGERATCPDPGKRSGKAGTLAIGNLTVPGPKRILGISVRMRAGDGLLSRGAPRPTYRDIEADIRVSD